MATFRTEHSELAGDLQTRMVDFLSPLVGLRLNKLGECSAIGRMPLWWRIREGAYWEFGHTAKAEARFEAASQRAIQALDRNT